MKRRGKRKCTNEMESILFKAYKAGTYILLKCEKTKIK